MCRVTFAMQSGCEALAVGRAGLYGFVRRSTKRIRLASQMPSAASTLAISRANVRRCIPLGLRMRAPMPPSDPSLRRSLKARLIARSLGLSRCER